MKSLVLMASILLGVTVYSQYQIGNYTTTFQDPERGNRSIQTEIYYPSTVGGASATVAPGEFPVIVFGHGFVMAWSAYENLWEEFVPRGYIMVFPRTEGNLLSTDHQAFGWDLEYLVHQMQLENLNATSPIHGAVAENTALMGHSMGGGAAFLAADSLCTSGNQNLKTLIGLAPAESTTNGVSSINSALAITVPSIVLSGVQDGVTPPVDHHIPMYNNLASDCKTFIGITGGAHCYFANSNFNCDFGEGTSSSGIAISRTEQHDVTFDFVNLWLDFTLKSQCENFDVFQDSLATSNRVTHTQSCNYQSLNVVPNTINPSCHGLSGSASVSITGGTASYTEDWGVNDPNTLPAGNYSVTVTDAQGCSQLVDIIISEPDTLAAALIGTDEILGDDGSITVNAVGGTPVYSYSINGDPFGPNNSFNDLDGGTYTIEIMDANGCLISENITIGESSTVDIPQHPFNNLVFYPVPIQNELTISFNSNSFECNDSYIIVTNLVGSVILQQPINSSSDKQTLNVSELSKGAYILTIKCDSSLKSFQLIK